MFRSVNIISLKSTTLNDSKLFYKLRFGKRNRSLSLNKNLISYQNHLKWFKFKINDKKNIYKTIYLKKNKIGYIRLDFNLFYYEISIAGSKKYQKDLIFSNAFQKLESELKKTYLFIAKVNNKNNSSLKFFKRNNFKIIKKNKEINFLSKLLIKNQNIKIDDIIKKIENSRKKNNVNWMNLLKLSFKNNPSETKLIFSKIKNTDREINTLSNKI